HLYGERPRPRPARRGAQRLRRHQHGGAVRREPARVGARRGGARGGDRALSGGSRAALGEIRSLARGRVHRADGTRAGQLPMRVALHSRPGFWRRPGAMLPKDFLQLRRDRVTFATMISIPLMQLVLFGYAINTVPRDLPTAVLVQESSDVSRTILKA